MRSRTKAIPVFSDHERFFKFIKISQGGDCWDWIGAKNSDGYGMFLFSNGLVRARRQFRAHRVSYSIFKGELSKDLVIDHICRNKSCVNPDHLREVTNKVNIIENSSSIAALHKAKNFCSNGHEYTIENTFYRSNASHRNCKQCNRNNANNYYLKKKER